MHDRSLSLSLSLWKLCKASGHGLAIEEVDILIMGKSHDLLSKDIHDGFITDVEGGVYDLVILSPLLWIMVRVNFANAQPPQHCRVRDHPWGSQASEWGSSAA